MCIAIVRPKNGPLLQKETARNCFINNPDGAGFAYCLDGKVLIKKGYFDFEEFWNEYNPIQESNNLPMLIHFRIATAGNKDAYNCHPWQINENTALIHNGTIQELNFKNSHISDSGIFARDVISKAFERNSDQFSDPWFRWLVEVAIGNNKVSIMRGDGSLTIYNESLGTWDFGLWFSNHSFKYRKSIRGFFDYSDDEIDETIKTYFSYPRKKKYRLSGDNKPLTPYQISSLIKENGKSFKQLLDDKIVVEFSDNDIFEDGELNDELFSDDDFNEDEEFDIDKIDELRYKAWLSKRSIF